MADNSSPPVSEPETAAAQRIVRQLSVYALVRTTLSSERALTAWMRTAIGLYTFGFSLEKFTDYLEQEQGGTQLIAGPRRLALSLVCAGMLVIVLAVAMHFKRVRRMTQLGLPRTSRFALPIAGTAVLLVIGIATLIGIALN